jgi:hypothetical protein
MQFANKDFHVNGFETAEPNFLTPRLQPKEPHSHISTKTSSQEQTERANIRGSPFFLNSPDASPDLELRSQSISGRRPATCLPGIPQQSLQQVALEEPWTSDAIKAQV